MHEEKEEESDDFTKRSLLTKIEKSSTSRQDVDLKQICNQDVVTFAEPGTRFVRRTVQIWWHNIKRQSIRDYTRRLEREGNAIGDASRRELDELGAAASPPTPSDSFAEETAEETTEETTEETADILTPFQDLSIRPSSEGRAVSFGSPPADSSIKRILNFDINKMNRTQDSGDGTKARPFRKYVDVTRPEVSRLFYILAVVNMKHDEINK
jgi:hypothetical protein